MRQKAKIVICAAFKNGFEILSFILENHHDVEFVATSDRDDSIYEGKITELCNRHGIHLLKKVNTNSESFITAVITRNIDLVFLAWWPAVVSKKAIDSAKVGWVNLHPSYLPYNRGKHPYYWSINDETPFGVTLHFIDSGVDTGDILFQEKIEVLITDTGESLYKKGDDACLKIFKNNFENIVNFEYETKKQDNTIATMHYAKDIVDHSRIDLEKTYKAKDLINIIRARTFFGGNSGYFCHEGKKYHIRVSIEEVHE